MRTFIKTLRFRILLITALCWLIPILILGGYLGNVFFSSYREQTESALLLAAEHAESNTLTELDRIIKLAKSVTYDSLLTDATTGYQAKLVRYPEFFRACRIYLDRKFFRESAFTFAVFFLIDEPTQFIPTTESTDQVTEFAQNAQSRALEISKTLDTRCHFLSANGHTYLIRNLYNRKLELYGMLVTGIRPEMILSPLLTADPSWKNTIDILLDDYQLLPSGEPLNPEAVTLGLTEQRNSLVLSGQAKNRDYTLTYRAVINKHEVYVKIYEFYQLMTGVVLLLLPVGALIMFFVQRRLTRPLHRLAAASGRIESGEFGVTVDIDSADEVGQLARCYNGMSLQIKHLIEKSFEEELIVRDARIEALQSRINPHFLNNTLEMINWQARIEGSENISNMIEAMSTLVNASLDRTNARLVSIEEELEVADAYFYFLEQRFGQKLSVEKEIDPLLLKRRVPRIAIQTLLENAVEHGIAPAGGGLIRMRIYASLERLVIDVCNNGRPLTDADSARIKHLLGEDESDMPSRLKERMGLRNINRRIKLIYGDSATLTLTRDERGDTLARLTLPEHEGNGGQLGQHRNHKQQTTSIANDIFTKNVYTIANNMRYRIKY